MALRWGFGLLWIILIFWLISLLWPDKDSLNPGSAAQGVPTAPPAAPLASPPQAPAAAANPPPAAAAASYGILAITYQGTSNEQQAVSIAVQLRDQLQPQPVQVRKHMDGGRTYYEVFIGQAAAKADLKNLLEQVRGLTLQSQPGSRPFHDAYITRIPKTTS